MGQLTGNGGQRPGNGGQFPGTRSGAIFILQPYAVLRGMEVMAVEQLKVRKVGNSLGLTLPAKLAKRLGLVPGQALDAHMDDGKLILWLPTKPRYALTDLIAQCNPKATMPTDLQAWEAAPAVGRELL